MSSPERAVPFYCPYCGEEDLRPHGETPGGWWCTACRRAWKLRYVGTGTPGGDAPGGDEPGAVPPSGDPGGIAAP